MNVREWMALRRTIHDDFYDDLVETSGCGAFDGGCVVVAQALQRVIGGDVVVLVRADDQADHAAVLSDGKLWDYDGPLTPSKFIDRLNRTELSSTPWRCVGYRVLHENDLPEAYRDDVLEGRLADLFRRILPGMMDETSIEPIPGPR